MICDHAYARTVNKGTGLMFCFDCKDYFYKDVNKVSRDINFTMPPTIYQYDEITWKRIRPWSRMPFEIAKKYHWYQSVLGMDDYLIMPVYWQGKPVFYSARRLTDNGGKKYMTPTGMHKYPWVSGKIGKVVLIGEGVADAAYMSQLASSVAILGNYYLEELAKVLVPAERIVIILDPDARGIEGAVRLVAAITMELRKRVEPVFLETDHDPTDVSLAVLRKEIKKQTGIKL